MLLVVDMYVFPSSATNTPTPIDLLFALIVTLFGGLPIFFFCSGSIKFSWVRVPCLFWIVFVEDFPCPTFVFFLILTLFLKECAFAASLSVFFCFCCLHMVLLNYIFFCLTCSSIMTNNQASTAFMTMPFFDILLPLTSSPASLLCFLDRPGILLALRCSNLICIVTNQFLLPFIGLNKCEYAFM